MNHSIRFVGINLVLVLALLFFLGREVYQRGVNDGAQQQLTLQEQQANYAEELEEPASDDVGDVPLQVTVAEVAEATQKPEPTRRIETTTPKVDEKIVFHSVPVQTGQ